MALRVQCTGGPLTVRALNLYLNPRDTRQVSTDSSADTNKDAYIASALPGTIITVRPGDTVYGFARIIFGDNEKAVRELALAIALANPTLFPDGKPRPLRVGERLTIPDLRTVQRIVADSGIAPESVFPPLPKKSTKSRKAVPTSKKPRKVARSKPSAASSSVGRAKSGTGREDKLVRTATGDRRPAVRRTGQLGLMFALSIDLGPSIGMTEARRAVLRQQLRAAVAIDSGVPSIPGGGPLSMRVAQVGEAQDGINAQIKLLSSKVAALQESVTEQRSAILSSGTNGRTF